MSFNNTGRIEGHLNHVFCYEGNGYSVIFMKIGLYNYSKGDKKYYETVNAQISCKLDQKGQPVTKSSHPKDEMNTRLYKYIKDNAVEGMPIKIVGNIHGVDQVYLNGHWKSFKKLTDSEREQYKAVAGSELITRNQTYLYIEEAKMPAKTEYMKGKEEIPESNIEEPTVSEPNQADTIETDDNDSVDNDGVVTDPEPEIIDATPIPREEGNTQRKKGYVPYHDMVFDLGNEVVIDDDDLPFR